MREETRRLLSSLDSKVLDALEYNIESVMLERRGEAAKFKRIPWKRKFRRTAEQRRKHRDEMREARASRPSEEHAKILEQRRQAYREQRAKMTKKELFHKRLYNAEMMDRYRKRKNSG